jgi:hypothetical protein
VDVVWDVIVVRSLSKDSKVFAACNFVRGEVIRMPIGLSAMLVNENAARKAPGLVWRTPQYNRTQEHFDFTEALQLQNGSFPPLQQTQPVFALMRGALSISALNNVEDVGGYALSFDAPLLSLSFKATKDITAGEELLCSQRFCSRPHDWFE